MDHDQGNSTPTKKGIRFEDLGEPIQQLMRAMQAKGRGDMSLLEYVGVRDVAKVLEAQGLGLEPDAIWDDLEAELIRRREARENPDLARQKEEERRRAEQERRQELRRAKALREQEEEQARREAEEQEAQRLREEEAARKAEQLERRRRGEEARLAAEAARQQQLAREREEEQRRQLEYAQRQAEAQREAERRTEAEQRVEAERRAETERQAAAERRAEAERQAVAERQAEAERRQREADERQAVERRRQELQAEEERLLLLRQAREAEVQRLEEVQRQHEAERQRWEEERRRQAEDFRARQEEEERRLQLLAAAQQAQEEERRRRREEEERQWQAEAEARRRQAEDERRQREAAQQHEELARRAALERRGQEDAAQRAQQAREAERLRQEEERLRLERLRLEEETAAVAAAAEREEAARRRREEALQERQREVEAEDARLLDTPYLQLEDVTVHWSYLAPGASQWEAFPAPAQQILEQALMESTARTAIPMPGQTWTAFVLDMYAQTARGEPFPIRRAYSDEPTVASRPAERTAPLAVWSSYNPLSRKWERFPLLVSRVLELKYRAGAPSVDVLILGKLRFSIVFRDMRQVSDAGFFRQVQRTEQRPVWERFSAHGGIPAWEELPGPVSQLLENCFAAGEQKAEIVSQDPAGQPRQYTLELDTMRAVAGDHVQGLRRQLRAADGGPAAEGLRAPPPAPPGPLPAPPVTLPPPPATRSAVFLEVYPVPPQLVQQVVVHRVPPSLRYPLAVGQTTVGREASDGPHSIVLQGAELSRRHCVVDVTPQGEVFVTDANSTGGTAMLSAGAYVRLSPMQRQRVEPGTFLALAQTLVRVGEVI